MKLELKILNGLERLSEALKSLLWEKAKVYSISPIQIQILLFVANHKRELSNVSHLAKEFHVTKATISDAVRVLVNKNYLTKDFSPTDNRRYNLVLSKEGKNLVTELSSYSDPVLRELATFGEEELNGLYDKLTHLVFQLNQKDVIQVQRTCFGCRFYQGDKKNQHYCAAMEIPLKNHDLRLDCNEFE